MLASGRRPTLISEHPFASLKGRLIVALTRLVLPFSVITRYENGLDQFLKVFSKKNIVSWS